MFLVKIALAGGEGFSVGFVEKMLDLGFFVW